MTSDNRKIQASIKKEEKEPREKGSANNGSCGCGCGCVPPIETK